MLGLSVFAVVKTTAQSSSSKIEMNQPNVPHPAKPITIMDVKFTNTGNIYQLIIDLKQIRKVQTLGI